MTARAHNESEIMADASSTSSLSSRRGDVVALANQKGGVGKTTTAISVAAVLATSGARILLVDIDPQGNATTGLGRARADGGAGTYGVLLDDEPPSDHITNTEVRGLDLLPAGVDLAGAEIELVDTERREFRLRSALAGVLDEYDVVLVDCPPSLGLLTINALAAAGTVLVPIQCEYYALEGLGQLLHTVQLVREGLNRDLGILGVVLTMFDARTNLSQQVVADIRQHFGDRALQTIIPRTVRLSEAPSFGQPISIFDPSSRGARAYARLAHEVATRLGLELRPSENELHHHLLAQEGRGTAGAATKAARPVPAAGRRGGPRPVPAARRRTGEGRG